MKNLIHPVIFCTLLISCNKEDNEPKSLDTFVEGRVLVTGTDQKATSEEMKVNLYREIARGNGLIGGLGEKLVSEGSTDSNGYFYFDFTAENDHSRHYIRIPYAQSTPPLFHRNESSTYIDIGKHQTRNIYLSPHAWLKLHIKNVNPQPGDVFYVNWNSFDYHEFYGAVNEKIILMGGGNINRVATFHLKRHGEFYLIKDTIWLPAWDTTYHIIEY